ncbi:hypothetical protein INS49_006500 [Diaporthe citri]|uniref:uncharacterized protein n=1 Tax=Diaporthe citri TaxID=83186 RepID=UPI001C804ED1|nr:uncharacterized protein INS49_006500 [Diaporthe citri]KAG6364896.1 hypothetical protein INS49_006500 [Diaporthe citri]
MLIIGLTGGIATGKSTVSSILSSPPYNLPIIDADLLARKVVEPGTPGYRAIVDYFGPSTPDLLVPASSEVFGDSAEAKEARARLNGIVHPAVRREAYRALLRAYLTGSWAVVWDVPLLFEVGTDRLCGTVVVVAVKDPAVQMERLRARDPHLSAEDAENRVRSQADVRLKARRCEARGQGRGIVVWNDGDREELRREVDKVMAEVRARSPWWWSTALFNPPPKELSTMGRGAAWPPNSFGEWVVGQNFKGTSRRSSGQTQVLKVSLSEDEASGDETLQVTFPGRRRGSSSTKQATPKSSSSRKKVSFDGERKPLKSALKKRSTSPSESSDTLVEDTSEDDATTEKDESSAIDESDTSEDEVWVKRNKVKAEKKPTKAPICKKDTDSEDSSAVKDALPHETCDCKDCVKGRRILKAMIKLDAKRDKGEDSKKGDSEKQKGQQKDMKKKAEATSTEAGETTETEATEEDKEPPSKQKKKKGQPKEAEKKPSPKEKKSSPKTAEPKQALDKTAFKLPTYPKSMEPNLIMPIKSNVVQCEHTIEGPNDPRPNAFIDRPAWASGGGNQGWGNDGNANGGDNAWGQTSGGDGKAKECDLSFLHQKHSNFEQPSNKSAKGSPNGGWNTGGGNNWNQQGGNPAGDTAWGEQSGNAGWKDPGNSGWNDTGGNAADGNQNWGAGSHHGSLGNANNDQGWNTQGPNRNILSGEMRILAKAGINKARLTIVLGGNTWGGPPGSRPASHHSRPPSNTGGGWGHGGWAPSHGNNTNNNNNGLPGNMPGSWENNAGAHSRKPSGSHQPPQGWHHSGPGNSPHAGDNGGQGWGGPSAPPGPPFSGQGGDQGWGGGSNKGGSQAGNWNTGGCGPGGGWDDNPSNNAGPTNNSWEANIAGDTKGAATNW